MRLSVVAFLVIVVLLAAGSIPTLAPTAASATTLQPTPVSRSRVVENVRLVTALEYRAYLPVLLRQAPPPPPVYVDHFGDPNSGWYVGPAVRYNEWCYLDGDCFARDEEVAYLNYLNGTYQFYIPLTWHGGGTVDTWFVWPVQTAPLPDVYYPLPSHYCIEASGLFANFMDQDSQPWWSHWGIVFGATENLSEVFTAQVNANHETAILRLHNYTYPGNRQPLSGEDLNVEIRYAGWAGDPNDIPTHSYNHLKVVVDHYHVDFYVNGEHVSSTELPFLPKERIGLIGGDWEVTPTDIRVDYFRYDPYCP